MSEKVKIKSKKVSVFYGDKKALDSINLEIPEKKVIDDILNQAHSLTPHKNNMFLYDVEVYGPEHFDEKKSVALATVCSSAGKPFRNSNKPEDFEKLEELAKELDA